MSTTTLRARFDWIDLILFAFGFVTTIGLAIAVREVGVSVGSGAIGTSALGLSFAPIAIRRAIFGAPMLPPPKTGALWSACSIVSGVSVLLGVGILALSVIPVGRALDPARAAEQSRHLGQVAWMAGVAVSMILLGALLTWARYPSVHAARRGDAQPR